MMKRAPIKAKRDKPRRNEGRVLHIRMKPKTKAVPTADEKKHMDRVAALGCLVCGGQASLHHVMKALGKVRRRDHRFVVPLCREHHQGDKGVHGLGSEKAFTALYGIDLAIWAETEWGRTVTPPGPMFK
ncbi:MAG: Ref family recombination enhancement nuclease [Beijerinckiaceae bacterium]